LIDLSIWTSSVIKVAPVRVTLTLDVVAVAEPLPLVYEVTVSKYDFLRITRHGASLEILNNEVLIMFFTAVSNVVPDWSRIARLLTSAIRSP
jgi:hypothetical protein